MKKVIFALLFLVSLLPVMAQRTRIVNKKLQPPIEKIDRVASAPAVFSVGTVKQLAQEPGKPLPFQFLLESNGQLQPLLGKGYEQFANRQVFLQGQLMKNGSISPTNVQLVDSYAPIDFSGVRHVYFPSGIIEIDYDPKELFTQPDQQPWPLAGGFSAYGTPYLTIPPPTWGTQKVLIVMFNFASVPQQPISKADMTSWIFTGATTGGISVNDYFQKASGAGNGLSGRYSITGQVTDWITIPDDPTNNCSFNLFNSWTDHALAQVPADVRAQYNRIIFFFPQLSNCPGPQSMVGTRGDTSHLEYSWIPIDSSSFSGDLLQLTFSSITHEYGHQLGLSHAQAIGANGFIGDVNDRAALMCDRVRYPNPYERLVLGWFGGKVTTVNSPVLGNFSLITPARFDIRGQKILLIPLFNPDSSFSGKVGVIETRTDLQIFYETFPFPYNPFTTGWAWRIFPADLTVLNSKSQLIDTTTETTTVPIFDNAAVQPGITWTDQNWGVTIHVTGTGSTGSLSGQVMSERAH